MTRLSGIAGSLFPVQFLATALPAVDAAIPSGDALERKRRQLERWWRGVESSSGPATGLRTLFDAVAMPLFGTLGFRATDAAFERARIVVRLEAGASGAVGLIVTAWAARSSTAWREVVHAARALGADWCFLLSPPFLSLVDARGHASRRSVDFTLPDAFVPASFPAFWTLARSGAPLDALLASAAGFQDRVRADLQLGVADALHAFGAVVRPGDRTLDESLTLVYRILFLLFAESRDLVPRSHPLYDEAYTITRRCRAAAAGDERAGLWDALAAITRLLRVGCQIDDLVVRPFNGRLFARASAQTLEAGRASSRQTPRSDRRDAAARRALAALGTRPGRAGRIGIEYADLGVEQLGAVYERVLDLDHPGAHSAERKHTGTFYTPQPLAEFVVRRTLAPLVSGATSDAILALRVVDPAMGSGAFLVAACRFLAAAYTRSLVAEGRCSETDLDESAHADARRLIAERCLFGVDANPVAVQLARLSLWLTTLARGKPLGFLDHRLRTGNSLIGASPDDLRRLSMRRQPSDLPLLDLETGGLEDAMCRMTRPLAALAARRDETIDDVRAKEAAWARLSGDEAPLHRWRTAADFWCARWFWPGQPPAPAEARAALDALLRHDATLNRTNLARWLSHTHALAAEHRFFHWPLEFADIFYDESGRVRDAPGFDAVIGNPPWEMLRRDSIAAAREPRNPGTAESAFARGFGGTSPRSHNLVRFIRDSGVYPSCDRGHMNLYQPFLDRALSLARPAGRVGMILPWGLSADDGAARLRTRLLDRSTIDTVVGLDNADALFPIHRGVRFVVVVANAGGRTHELRARFGVRTNAELDALPARDDPAATAYPIRLTPATLARVGGRTRRFPDARSQRDLELLQHIAGVAPPLGSVEGWTLRFGRELNVSDDRGAFSTRGLPAIEGKHLQPFVVDYSTARLHVTPEDARRLLPDRRFERARLAYRDVSAVGNRVTLIAAIVPAGVVTTHTLFCLRTAVPAEAQQFLCGLFNSYVLNFVVRLLMGGHLTTSLIEDLPVPRWTGDRLQRRIAWLARRLAHRPDASSANAILQAAVARLYALDAAMFDHVLRGFPLVPEVERQHARRAFAL
ncbi:MAG TPA: N-6 DNA methylase [Vicinamibacterales bacterium]|nr:N-6 DNA methylase [Vicinamibacterales bacterium]